MNPDLVERGQRRARRRAIETVTVQARSGTTRSVGRVGGLAAALGIGAVLLWPGSAFAESDSDAGGAAARDSVSAPSQRADAGDRDPTSGAGRRGADQREEKRAAKAESNDRGGEPRRAKPNKKPKVDIDEAAGERDSTASDDETSGKKPGAVTAEESRAPRVDRLRLRTEAVAADDAPNPDPDTAVRQETPAVSVAQTVPMRTTVAVGIARELDAPSTDVPESPLTAPALVGTLGLVRRDLEQAHTPAAPEADRHTAVDTASDVAVQPSDEAADDSARALVVSPLATPEQLAAERLATQIARSPIVALAKVVLKAAWLITGYVKFAAVGGPDLENLKRLDQAVDEYALQAALELQLLNSHNPAVIQMVMPPHTWFGQSFGGARILYDNPDTIYRMIPVNYGSSYVISGQFTGPLPVDTTFSVLTGLTGTTTSVLSTDDLVRDADGRFTITLDSRATNPDNPNHLQLPPGATLIAARNTLADWNTEVPMTLEVQRVGGPPDNLLNQLGLYAIPGLGPLFTSNPLLSGLASAIPRLSPVPRILQNVETAIVMMLGLFMEPQYISVATDDAATGKPKAPNTLSDPASNASFLATQLQSAGYFQLADDEALVITIDRGNAGYFNVPVTDVWTVTGNYWDEQTSLNSFQAAPDTVGGSVYTIVVSPTDPQVANWVSTGGLNLGTLSIRFQDLDPASSSRPTVSATVVKVADVLPPGATPFTAEQRAAQIALRQSGYDKRYAPYPQ